MARKRIFTDRKSRQEAWGGKRRPLSFPELDRGTGFSENLSRRMKKLLPAPVYERVSKIRGIHLAVIFICAAVVGFLIWFFFFIYPSPIGDLKPSPKSSVNDSNVDIKASFSREPKKNEISLKVDGKDMTSKSSLSAKGITCKLGLTDGQHKVKLTLEGGGLMGKRNAEWSFTVDTSPPKLTILKKKITDIEDSDQVRVTLSGETEKGAQVKVGGKETALDAKGRFNGSATSSRYKSLKITASDKAGNQSNTYIVTQKQPDARGVHVSVYVASSDSSMDKLIDLVERTELNTLEIDLKDESGQIGFEIDNELAKKVDSDNDYIRLDRCVDKLRYRDIYTICRIVVFKDPKLARGDTNLAVLDKYGGLWGKGLWVDPYSKQVWDYNLAVAVAAARAGFNEVQFDYIRFPSDGDTSTCLYPNQDGRSQSEVIDGFLSYAREKLAPYNVFISADLFGLTASKQGEMGIGQNVKDIANRVDFISPMFYPSHYNPGEYNIKDPEANPHDTVEASLKDFEEEIAGTQTKLRPWLQDFSLRVTYDADMVRRQINAVNEAGITQWLLWDPDCTFSEAALKKSSE